MGGLRYLSHGLSMIAWCCRHFMTKKVPLQKATKASSPHLRAPILDFFSEFCDLHFDRRDCEWFWGR